MTIVTVVAEGLESRSGSTIGIGVLVAVRTPDILVMPSKGTVISPVVRRGVTNLADTIKGGSDLYIIRSRAESCEAHGNRRCRRSRRRVRRHGDRILYHEDIRITVRIVTVPAELPAVEAGGMLCNKVH